MRTLNSLIVAHRKSIAVLLASILAVALVGFSGSVSAGPTKPQAPEGGASCPGGQCFQDVPPGNPFFDYANNLYIDGVIGGYACGGPGEPCVAPANRPYYRPASDVTRAQMTKFVDLARKQPGIDIDTDTHLQPLIVRTTAANGMAVVGQTVNGYGVYGLSNNVGVLGYSTGAYGVQGYSTGGYGVYGGSGAAGYAGYFNGRAHVTGDLSVVGSVSKGGGSFKIDHPLDPENKYLYHSFVESPDMMNVYNGNVVLDGKGEAVVTLPDYFETLNQEFRYQLTPIGAPGPDLYIAQEVTGNTFKIAGGKAGTKVSWQVTGIRQDPYAEKYRIPVEEDKSEEDRGKYLYPDVYGQPDSKQIGKTNPPLPSIQGQELPGTQP
ncbi:MAG TPA: hypothetical protein VF826_16925 [Chloroflexia bacterium]|jgi:hypothetical protein